MKIEAIAPSKRGKDKLHVRFDNGTGLTVPAAVATELRLCAGLELSPAALESLRDTCALASAKERAVRIVAASAVSQRELERRLVRKGESEEHAQEAVQWLSDLRLLDDSAVAAQIVRSGAAKGYGPARIRQMLFEKRVPRELWDEALAALPEQDDAIDEFLRRRFRGQIPDRAECKRATDALLRRGHSWSDIRRALERYAPDEEFSED